MERLRLPSLTLSNQLAGQPSRRSSRRDISPEEEESIVRRVGRTAIGGLGAVGNLLDLPGSMVRDVVTGNNPLDQLLSPLSYDNRTSGRDMLRQFDMAGKKDTWGNFLGGLAAEIGTDPLTYILPFGAFTKAGQAVKNAGLIDDVRLLASKAGKIPVGQLGPRQAMAKTKFGDVLKAVAGTPQEEALKSAAKKAGVDVAAAADEPLRGAFGLGVFGKPLKVMGTGAKAERYAQKVDSLGRAFRYGKIPGTEFSPMDKLATSFNAKLGGVKGETAQVFARQAWNAREAARAAANIKIAEAAATLQKHGWGGEEYSDVLRSIWEHPNPDVPHQAYASAPREVQEAVDSLRKFKDGIRDMVRAEGGDIGDYVSPEAAHWPRSGPVSESIPSGSTTSQPFNATNPNAWSRNPLFSPYVDDTGFTHAIKDETSTLKKLIKDAEINDLIDGRRPVEEIAEKIRQKYGDVIPDKFVRENGKVADRYEALADWIANLPPEHREMGFFANNPVNDLHSYAANGLGQAGALRAIREFLVSPGVLHNPGRAANQTGWKTLREALESVPGKIDQKRFGSLMMHEKLSKLPQRQLDEFLDEVAANLGKDLADIKPDDVVRYLLDHRITDDVAQNLERIAVGFTTPRPVGEIVKAIDNFTNIFKGFQVAPWPAFHVRNLISGQVQNWINGTWSPDSVGDAFRMLKGGAVKGAKDIQAVKQLAAQRGITNLTDEVATDLLGQLAYAHNMTGTYAGEVMSQAGLDAVYQPQQLDDILQQISQRGANNMNFGRMGRKFVAREKGTSWNPLDIRGVKGKRASGFGPMAAGEEVAHSVEGMNRIAPFIKMLREGVDPAEAARRVGRAQVFYDSRYYTALERDVLQRLIPFYKFSSRMPIWMVHELIERPGGKLAQVIRATNSLRDPHALTPDYVQETTSIPLGKSPDGSRSYLTGAGLMHEDPASFLSGGGVGRMLRGAGLEALSRTNPLVKMPMEWATGQSFFQKGIQGGRQLEDLDPTIGRLLANLTGQEKAVRWPGSQGMEHVASNLIGRPLTTARTLSYPLAEPSGGEIAKTLTNLLTGARVTRVRPGAQDAILREALSDVMKKTGAKTFTRTYIPEDVEAGMSPQELADAKKLEDLMHVLSMRAKARREAKQQSAGR